MRRCSRTACTGRATSTLTYVYADSLAVVGPLALSAHPGGHDLCSRHAEGVTVPRGWEVIRLPDDPDNPANLPPEDDLMALADAIREVGNRPDEVAPQPAELAPGIVVLAEKRHLRVLADPGRD